MSYIDEALRKAQTEKDNCYGKVNYVAAAVSARRGRPWQRRTAVFAALVLVVAAGVLFSVKFFRTSAVVAQKTQESLRRNEPPLAGSAKKGEAPNPARPVALVAAKAGTPQQGEAKASAAAGQKLQDDKKAADIKRRHEEAALAQRNGKFSTAKILYGEILTLDADNVEALNNLGVVYLAEKKGDKALALFRQAVLRKRDYVDPYYNMACFYAQKNDVEQSLWYLKMAISIDKDVINWVKKDVDMKKVVASPKFKEIDGGVKD